MLEIGAGGYDSPISGGESLRMWKTYFPFAFCIRYFDKSFLEEKGSKFLKEVKLI
jgi:demethylmacrocin O-methyltransferase